MPTRAFPTHDLGSSFAPPPLLAKAKPDQLNQFVEPGLRLDSILIDGDHQPSFSHSTLFKSAVRMRLVSTTGVSSMAEIMENVKDYITKCQYQASAPDGEAE